MEDKNILIFSHIPTHVSNKGHRLRLYTLLKAIKGLGFKIHFIYFPERRKPGDTEIRHVDIDAMKECWDGFYEFNPLNCWRLFIRMIDRTIDRCVGIIGLLLNWISPKAYNSVKSSIENTGLEDKIGNIPFFFYLDNIKYRVKKL